MFGSKKAKQNFGLDSLVGTNTKLLGDVHFSGGLHIDGDVQGNVIAEGEDSVLTTSEKGKIEGNVHVHNIILNGEVIGDVYALKHIELSPNARVTGNVYYNLIEMAGGAEVNGSLIHYDNKEKSPVNQTGPSDDAEPSLSNDEAAEEPRAQGGYN